jgi:predicted short-subunit dehydrogenase-like oxidoreductase (DUF2520 family)
MAQSHPTVAIVGAGAVAQAIGRLLLRAGVPVAAVASRTRAHAEQAARFISGSTSDRTPAVGTPVVVEISEVPRLASHVLVAVADRGIEPVADALAAAGMRSGAALHTCGGKGPEALKPLGAAGVACGMLHPLQTIMTAEQGASSLSDVTFGLAGDPAAIRWGAQIVTSLHGRAIHIDASRLSYYHAGAVMASNALIAAIDAAVVLLGEAGVDRAAALEVISPLARTSVNNALASGPQSALTGPIVRGDTLTVAAHVRALRTSASTVARLYGAAAAHLLTLAARRGLPIEQIRALEDVIDDRSGPGRAVAGE